ncbi:hypothetical protein FRC10_002095 [Ceratobasidium sp. 414]|nr:hypothetical protein FRC10_002095 [Ceratobasidium sp. 414]
MSGERANDGENTGHDGILETGWYQIWNVNFDCELSGSGLGLPMKLPFGGPTDTIGLRDNITDKANHWELKPKPGTQPITTGVPETSRTQDRQPNLALKTVGRHGIHKEITPPNSLFRANESSDMQFIKRNNTQANVPAVVAAKSPPVFFRTQSKPPAIGSLPSAFTWGSGNGSKAEGGAKPNQVRS